MDSRTGRVSVDRRQVFDLAIERVQTSCGSGVPEMAFKRSRGETELVPFYEDMGPEGVAAFWRRKNRFTVDGKPTGIDPDGP
ncbi:MAG: hypothetical protein AAGA11_09185 [Pseudomonadota bacterium]